MNTDSLAKKKTCTGSKTQGSFGYCRQLQQSAAEKGPAAHKKNCGGGGTATTAAAVSFEGEIIYFKKRWTLKMGSFNGISGKK